MIFIPPTNRKPQQNQPILIVVIGLLVLMLVGGIVFYRKSQGETPLPSVHFIILGLIVLGAVVSILSIILTRTSQTPTGTSIPEQIEQLAKLKEQGILTQREFEEKKQELLSRL